MPYVLGIDIGESTTTAAVCRRSGASGWGEPRAVALSPRCPALASVLRLTADGEFLPGDPDDPSGAATVVPGGVARGFLRRVGDETPLVVGGESYWAHSLVAALVRWVVDAVWELEQGPAEQIALAHPTGWGAYRLGLLDRALREAGVPDVALLSRAWAVVERHEAAGALPAAAGTSPPGVLAVCRLDDTTVEAAAVARTGPGGYDVVGHASIDDLGGADIEDAPPADARSAAQATVDLLAEAVRTGGAAPADVTAVLLAGEPLGQPLVTALIADAFRRPIPIVSDDEPSGTVARGAAVAACRALAGWPAPSRPAVPDAPRPDPSQADPSWTDPPWADPPWADPAWADPPWADPPWADRPWAETSSAERPWAERPWAETPWPEPAGQDGPSAAEPGRPVRDHRPPARPPVQVTPMAEVGP